MADYVATTEDFKAVADAIRNKGGTSAPLSFPDEFASAIQAIPVPKPEQVKEISISENGDFPITPDVGKVLSKVLAHVNVSGGGGGSVQMGPFVYMYGGTFTPASDMEIFNPPGYVYDTTYKNRPAVVIGTKTTSRDGVHIDVGVDFMSTRVARSGSTTNKYAPQASTEGIRLHPFRLKAGVEYMYIIAQYVY